MELANGYAELTDANEQKSRFEKDIGQRLRDNKSAVAVDNKFIEALESGLPPCAGVALGVDRLLMQLLAVESIAQVMPFSWDRC
jgi:lysyl-tRNA synthetase class 2